MGRTINYCYFKRASDAAHIVINIDEIEAWEDGAIFMRSGRQIDVRHTCEEIKTA